MNYKVYSPSREIQLEPAESARYFFGPNSEDWVQVLNVDQMSDAPLRYCVKLGGLMVGAKSRYGVPGDSNPFLLVQEGYSERRYLKIDKVPTAVFGRVRVYEPVVVQSQEIEEIDSSTLVAALDAVVSAVIARSIEAPPRGMSGIALPESLFAKV